MKRIFTADLHLHSYSNDPKKLEDGTSLKLKELFDCFKQVCEYARNNSMPIIIGGDIAHKKSSLDTIPFVKFKKILDEYNDVQFIIFEGNHGRSSSTNNDIGIELLHSNNVKVIKDVLVDGNITYIPDSNNLYDNIKSSKKNKILCSHFPVTGAKNDGGFELDTQFKMEDLKKFKLVLVGDIHNFQEHKTPGGKLYYPGSLIPTNRSEIEQKGFIVFDDESLDVEFIPVTGYRQYHLITINETTDINSIESKIKELKDQGHNIVLKKEVANIPKNLDKFIDDIQIMDAYKPEYNIRGITASMNLDDQFKKYMEIMNIDKSEMNDYLNVIKGVISNADQHS